MIQGIRSGNYVQDSQGVWKVTDIINGVIHAQAVNSDNIKVETGGGGFEPIQVSDVWMRKFGFTKVDNQSDVRYTKNGVTVLHNEIGNTYGVLDPNYKGNITFEHTFEYVHQLQNIFKDQTGLDLSYESK